MGARKGVNDTAKLLISVLAVFTAAGIGSLFTFKAIPVWYAALKKPRFTPPRWAFGPVWTVLYSLMAVSIFLVWREGLSSSTALFAFVFFWIQLTVNAVWSIVFFGVKSKGGGVAVILVLWLLILATMIASFRVSGWAGAMLVPYLIWVTVASYLNIGVWRLNKSTTAGF